MIAFLLTMPIWWLFILFAEYWSHRLVMHLPIHTHRKQHHEQHQDHPVWFHIDLPVYYHILVASPILLMHWRAYTGTSMLFDVQPSTAIGSALSLVFLLFVHSYIWSKLHRAFHKIERHNWTVETKFYDDLLDHHIEHHRHPEYNFGVMSTRLDKLFGTKWKETK